MSQQHHGWNYRSLTRASLMLVLGLALGQAEANASISEANADLQLQAVEAALNVRERVISDISTDQIRSASQDLLNTLVRGGVSALRGEGYANLANGYESDWNRNYSEFLRTSRASTDAYGFASGVYDLGDHQPLFAWLARFYDSLENRLGTASIHSGILGDIYAVNYALPVVFTPKGKWRGDTFKRDSIEYRKHFIPLANVMTYWGTKTACNQLIKKTTLGAIGGKLCGFVSDKLRFVMGRYIAPKISDFAFNTANGVRGNLSITTQDLVYVDAKQLVNEFNNGFNHANGGAK